MGDGGYLVARPMPELAPVVRTVWVTTLNLTARAGCYRLVVLPTDVVDKNVHGVLATEL
jgi:hypothetical protein